MRFTGVIPARHYSSRLPGKCLLEIAGKPMIQWVYERSLQSRLLSQVIIATDDGRVMDAARRFNGQAVMTDPHHRSGTDRVAEICSRFGGDVFVNIQGDEPLISPRTIDAVCRPFQDDPDLLIATARVPLQERGEIESPHNVKVVTDRQGRALYFSRCPIPYERGDEARHYKHLGIYAYRRSLLERLPEIPPSELEAAEQLEQLRFLESGIRIQVVEVDEDSIGVDTREDLDAVRLLLENEANNTVQGVHTQAGR